MIRKNFCAAPWAGLSVGPGGRASVCCISTQKVKFTSVEEFQNHPKIVEIRQAVINDQQHENCKACWDRESQRSSEEINSRRSIYQYDDFYNDLNSATSYNLEHLDLRWNNTCNLNCVYCGPVYSSKWATLLKQKQSARVNTALSSEQIKNLKYLQLAGGEPLLIKENLQLVKDCLEVNPLVQVEVTTNLTSIKNNEIYNLLRHFENIRFVVSFESVEDRFEYIRNGANWTTFRNNLDCLVKDFESIDFTMVYFPLSASKIGLAIELAQQYTRDENIFLVTQVGGHGFDMLSEKAVEYIKQKNQTIADSLSNTLKQQLNDQINSMTTNKTSTVLPYYDKFDRLTNQNHREIFKELYQ